VRQPRASDQLQKPQVSARSYRAGDEVRRLTATRRRQHRHPSPPLPTIIFIIIIIIIIFFSPPAQSRIYIAQVRKGHKCAMSAEMAVWLRNSGFAVYTPSLNISPPQTPNPQYCCLLLHDFARHHHINCLFRRSGSQPSVDAHFQSLHPSLLCNSLPSDTQSFPSLPVARQRLKTFLFCPSFPKHTSVTLLRVRGLRNSSAILATLKLFD